MRGRFIYLFIYFSYGVYSLPRGISQYLQISWLGVALQNVIYDRSLILLLCLSANVSI